MGDSSSETKKFQIISVDGNVLVVKLPEGTREMAVADDFKFNVDGKMLSMPFNSSTAIVYWNKDAFTKAGLDPEKPPKTWPETFATAKKLRDFIYAAGGSQDPADAYIAFRGRLPTPDALLERRGLVDAVPAGDS